MKHHKPPDAVMPVRAATFPDGPDSVLLNPDIPQARWRGERVRAGLRPRIVLTGLAGAALAALAAASGSGFAAVFALGAGGLALGVSLFAGWYSAARVLADHRHGRGSPCRLDRVRGEFFFRSRDFTDLGTASYAVRTLIAGVGELHCGPARAWIDPGVPREVHRVAWQALCCLDRTRAARDLAHELADDPDSAVGELAAAAREAVTVIDDALDEIVRHVHGCLVLTRAWEAKLRHGELAVRTDHILAALPGDAEVRRLSEAAEALPQNVFAYITAARDITGTGAFPWKRPPSSWSRLLRILPRGLSRGAGSGTAPARRVQSGEGLS
ncbi:MULTISPECIES: hypothetical protein [Amycolatopsis]|uniref:Uncharacterized protein n=1 Tax=Amycolatopsis echigonensis TaxID=2576905 RepID=A0A2N3WF63_9PSEU|nr:MULTISPECIES: hypothetical protein [Amycolatopsis]MBB2505454.1 hypothetical protein [Amycolatopsis echigonensis]PKV92469.1 hypothetical protein ATK30_3274 [Amycolatopsis niigatensis]UIJ59656.1 hypothetical protein LWP59_37500 [Amycolatopsis acidiphila]GHG81143.1 hypothetical protein GCM10017788_50830 [Amycolatopsis acidiphila]